MINWNKISRQEYTVITKIVNGAKKLRPNLDKTDLVMDISAAHLSCPLKLKEFAKADDFNLMHDVIGIRQHLNRQTGKLEDCFLPRFTR